MERALFAASGLTVCVVAAAIALYLVVKELPARLKYSWLICQLSVGLYGLGSGMAALADDRRTAYVWLCLSLDALPLITVSYYYFALAVSGLSHLRRTVMRGMYFMAACFMVVLLLAPETAFSIRNHPAGMYYKHAEPVLYLMTAWWFALAVDALLIVVRSYRQAASRLHRTQLRLFTWGAMVSFVGAGTAFLPAFEIPVPLIGNWFIPAFNIVATYAIIRYRLLDIQSVLPTTVVWICVSSLFLIPYHVGLMLVWPWLRLRPVWQVTAATAALLAVITWYYRAVQPRIDVIFQRRKHDLQEVLDALLQRLAVVDDAAAIASQLLETLAKTLYVSHAGLWVWDAQQERYELVGRLGGLPADAALTRRDAFVEWLQSHPGVYEREELDRDPRFAALLQAGRGFCERSHAVMCVSLGSGARAVGLLSLGPKPEGRPYTTLEVEFLDRMRVGAGIALGNAVLYGRVRRLNHELTQLNSRLEAIVKERTAELARSNAELEQFAYVASHDLQEPLRMVASYTQLLQRRYEHQLGAEADQFIHYAVDGVLRMQRLIQDLLEYSRVSRRGRPFERVACRAIVDQVIGDLQVAIQESGARIELGDLPDVIADRVQLARVFQNLLSNAIKFHGDQPARVRVWAEAAGREWCFNVQDDGIGIAPQFAGRLFVIFQRLHTQQEYPGTGIGLAICKKILERHGGRIWCEPAQPRGTVFRFTLPGREST